MPRTYSFGMSQAHQSLTEKEKQTLRLVGTGYDAKSMARHLGLSVHTVNERLRDARRKLAVSSSREAARMLREAEAQAPEMLGDKALGDAPAAAAADDGNYHDSPDRRSARIGWIIEGSLMSLALAFLAYAALSGTAPTSPSPATTTAAETAPAAAAGRFMALLDARDWAASYLQTSDEIRTANPEAVWADVHGKVRAPLGAMRKRQLLTDEYVPTPRGYWLVKYRTDYANRAAVVETLSLVRDGTDWKIAGIVID